MYYFYYNSGTYEIYRYLKSNTHKRKYIDFDTGIGFSCRNNKIILQEKKLMVHPLQRRFTGKIIPLGDETLIAGNFRYPLIASLCFFVLTICVLRGNIELFLSAVSAVNKIYAAIGFLFIYGIIAGLFITGKTFYKKQESNVIELLQHIAQKYYKD